MNTLINFVRGGGWAMWPLLLLSIGALGVIIERLIASNSLGSASAELLPQVLKLARARRFDEAIKICDAQNGPVVA